MATHKRLIDFMEVAGKFKHCPSDHKLVGCIKLSSHYHFVEFMEGEEQHIKEEQIH